MRYLGLDLGTRTLGVAISDKNGVVAQSLKTIRHDEDYSFLVSEVVSLIHDEKIEGIVLGYPKNMNNSIGFKAQLSEQFRDLLLENVSIPVYLQDERLTTSIANQVLIDAGTRRKRRKQVVDAIAAQVILQSYLDRRKKDGRE